MPFYLSCSPQRCRDSRLRGGPELIGKAVGWAWPRGTSVTGRHCQVVEWQTAPEGLLRRIGGGWAQKLSAYAEGRGSEGKQWWVGKKEKETGVGRGDGGPLS